MITNCGPKSPSPLDPVAWALHREPKIITAAELSALTLPEPRWAIPDLLPEGLTILGGKPKTGKSWLALDMGLAVSTGTHVFGKGPVREGEVLYIALEDTLRRLKDRLTRRLGSKTPPTSFHLVTTWPRLKEGGREKLEAWLKEHCDARLIILDTIVRVRPRRIRGADIYEEDTALGVMLQDLAQTHRIAVLALHHQRKAPADDIFDTISGSNGLTGAADAVVVLTRKRGSAVGNLAITGRDIQEQDIALRFNPDQGQWIQTPTTEPALSPQRQAILDAIAMAGKPLEPKEIAERTQMSHDSVRQLVRRLHEEGYLEKVPSGYILRSPVHSITEFTQ